MTKSNFGAYLDILCLKHKYRFKGRIMSLRVRKHNKNSLGKGIEALDIASPTVSPSDSKDCGAIEQEIGMGWHASAKLRWNFNGFATAMLEVLTVLHERDRLKAEKVKRQAGGV